MKKTISVILAVLMLASLCVSVGASGETVKVKGYKSISVGASYVASLPYTGENAYDYVKIDGKELTDGVKGSTQYGTEWYGFYNFNDGINVSPYSAVIDLGSEKSNIAKINMEFRKAGSGDGVGEPSKVEYFVSDNNTSFTALGVATKNADGTYNNYELVLGEKISGRYFKAVITKGNGVLQFCSEFEICEETEIEVELPDSEDLKVRFTGTSGICRTDDGYIRGAKGNNTLDGFCKQITDGSAGLTFFDYNNKEKTTGNIATGDTVKKTVNGVLVDTFKVIIDGDVTRDGIINGVDYAIVKRTYLNSYTLEGEALKAACVSGGDTVAAVDYAQIKRSVLGTFNLEEKYKFKNPVYDSEMTFTKTNGSVYKMTGTYNGKAISLGLYKKSWGTWNIGSFMYDGKVIGTGDTDWEYVYRAGATKSSWVWSGGNHGNETLVSLRFFDTETKKEYILANNSDSFTAKGITIVEKTKLHWGNADNYYADVTRTYYIAGNNLTLDVDYNYVKDCYLWLSYTCMFPVYKTYGRNTTFHHTDNTETTFRTTDGTVYEAYSGHFAPYVAADKVTFSGDSQPTWKYDVEVLTPFDSTDNFSNSRKTMLWDMNQSCDKLYFSKFEENAATLQPAGTNVGTRSSWTFYVDD